MFYNDGVVDAILDTIKNNNHYRIITLVSISQLLRELISLKGNKIVINKMHSNKLVNILYISLENDIKESEILNNESILETFITCHETIKKSDWSKSIKGILNQSDVLFLEQPVSEVSLNPLLKLSITEEEIMYQQLAKIIIVKDIVSEIYPDLCLEKLEIPKRNLGNLVLKQDDLIKYKNKMIYCCVLQGKSLVSRIILEDDSILYFLEADRVRSYIGKILFTIQISKINFNIDKSEKKKIVINEREIGKRVLKETELYFENSAVAQYEYNNLIESKRELFMKEKAILHSYLDSIKYAIKEIYFELNPNY